MAPSGFRTLERQKHAVNPGKVPEYPQMQNLTAPHIESFNSIWERAGPSTPALIDVAMSLVEKSVVFDGKGNSEYPLGNQITFWIDNVRLDHPMQSARETMLANRLQYPTECRQRGSTYRGRLYATLHMQVNNSQVVSEERFFGNLPIMVRSNRCNLNGMGPAELIAQHEEPEEMGGYFIVNGNEKVVRLLIATRRNHVIAIQRPSYANRGPGYTPYATQIRCVRRDQTSQTLTMHYLATGNLLLRFSMRKQEYLVPVSLLMRALTGASDKEIFDAIVGGDADNIFVRDRVELLLRTGKEYSVYTKNQALSYLGDKFRIVVGSPEDLTNVEVGQRLLDRVLLVHLSDSRDKFNMLAHMVRKLYALVSGECQEDNPDAQQLQEVYMPGHLYLGIIKEKFEDYLLAVRAEMIKDIRLSKIDLYNTNYLSRTFGKVNSDIGTKLGYFLATGNLVSRSGLDMQQVTGYTIIAEKLNYLRYLSHFRCIHRGAFFAELKTTTVRKLLPEGWGFLCPVHTPDGSPCGLLNHLAHKCLITTTVEDTADVVTALMRLGVEPGMPKPTLKDANLLTVQLDGCIVGYCSQAVAIKVAEALRILKLQAQRQRESAASGSYASLQKMLQIPYNMEIGLVPLSQGGQLPGLYLFTTPARFVRPVTHLGTQQIDHVGSFEQVYMEIACLDADMRPGVTTHQEVLPTHILSAVANFTPFCDFNQSPRNMYQCLTVDHDVLTRQGWKAIDQVATTDEVMTMNLQSGAQQWKPVENVAKVEHPAEKGLYRMQGPGIDAVCDAQHRWYMNSSDKPADFESFTVSDMAASGDNDDAHWHSVAYAGAESGAAVVHKSRGIPTVGRNNNADYAWPECPWLSTASDAGANLGADWCRFVGVALSSNLCSPVAATSQGSSSGSSSSDSSTGATVQIATVSKGASSVAALLARLAAAVSEFVVKQMAEDVALDRAVWTVEHAGVASFVRQTIAADISETGSLQTSSLAKAAAWATELSAEQARAFIEGCSYGHTSVEDAVDGKTNESASNSKGSAIIAVRSASLVQILSIVGLLANASVGISAVAQRADEEEEEKSTGIWAVSISYDQTTGSHTVAAPKPVLYTNPQHDGFVYCLQVADNENFMARRHIAAASASSSSNGAVAEQFAFFTGNCQMGKQTMGTPMQSFPYRTDNKLYRIQTGQTPICRPRIYDDYGVDGYPNGANAVVAVISYTGYDMEDAMILNKSGHERGFGYGSIYKTEYIDLGTLRKSGEPITQHFGLGRDCLSDAYLTDRIDIDGLPYPGIPVKNGDPLYTVLDDVRGRTKIMRYKGETGYIETVRLIANNNDEELQTIAITYRIPRSPIIGDKFSSRHGQKGVCSQKFPAVDMPFTESGMQPDVIINPHAFPSRMTIGMFVESIAAKAGALHGVCQDSTPFQFDENNTAADYFGEQLRKAGYNFHGSEPMYSGVTGQEMRADIYIGVVYYQRLRHMVSDKYQVRTTGPINPLTQQPIKGRKRGGGIRLGEMERDALIAHGTAFFLQDRLMNCSDYSLAYVCKCCGSVLAPVAVPATTHVVDLSRPGTKDAQKRSAMFAGLSASEARAIMASVNGGVSGGVGGMRSRGPLDLECRLCGNADGITMVALPYVFRYLATELMSMNMKLKLEVK